MTKGIMRKYAEIKIIELVNYELQNIILGGV